MLLQKKSTITSMNGNNNMYLTTANILTFIRILFAPILAVAFYIESSFSQLIAAFVFMLGCITDYLDGYIARAWSQTSKLGQFLDPMADKLLIATALLLLAGFDRITRYSLIPALIILCREILVSGLREHLSDIKVNIRVSKLAKWKTAVQMLAISVLLIGDSLPATPATYIGEGLLWIAALLTIKTGYDYLKSTIRYFA